MGLLQLLVEHAQIRRLVPQSHVRRRREARERFRLPLRPQNRSQVFLGRDLGRHVPRRSEGPAHLRHERRHDRSEHAKEYRCVEEGRLASGRRNLSRRNQRILAVPRHHARGDEDHPDHGLPPTLRGLRRKGRHVRQLRALAAVEARRGPAAGRSESGSGDSGPHLPQGAGALYKRRWQIPRPDPERGLELLRPS